jgi:hypothetical protein
LKCRAYGGGDCEKSERENRGREKVFHFFELNWGDFKLKEQTAQKSIPCLLFAIFNFCVKLAFTFL